MEIRNGVRINAVCWFFFFLCFFYIYPAQSLCQEFAVNESYDFQGRIRIKNRKGNQAINLSEKGKITILQLRQSSAGNIEYEVLVTSGPYRNQEGKIVERFLGRGFISKSELERTFEMRVINEIPTSQDITGPLSPASGCGVQRLETTLTQMARNIIPAQKDSSEDCGPTASHPACRGKRPCSMDRIPEHRLRRLTPLVIEAVNEINQNRGSRIPVHPATVLAMINAETVGDPLAVNYHVGNPPEREEDLSPRFDGGLGLGQFTVDPDLRGERRGRTVRAIRNYGLVYPEKGQLLKDRPDSEQEAYELDEPLKNPDGSIQKTEDGIPLYSIWSPKGNVLAMTRKIMEDLNSQEPAGSLHSDFRILFTRNPTQQTRFVATMYNRGYMFRNSVRTFARRNNGKLPSEFGQAWNVPRLAKNDPPYPILWRECLGRCHVERIAGVCGDEPDGFFKEYLEYLGTQFKEDNGRWIPR